MVPRRAGNEAMVAADVAYPIKERPIPCKDLILQNFLPLTILDNFRGFASFLVNSREFVML